jgi:DNA primase
VTSVSMPEVLRALSIVCNERTRRAPCVIHGGSNPSAFAWRDSGLWYCHSCRHGGDKIALVREVRQCSFRQAVEFLAALAGIEYRHGLVSRKTLERQRRHRERETAEADSLLAREFVAWCEARDVVLQLEAIRRNAGERLQAMHRGEHERWAGETDLAWEALAEVYRQMPRAAAAYNVISFAAAEDRFAFAMDAAALGKLVEEAPDRGWVADSKGYRFEVIL